MSEIEELMDEGICCSGCGQPVATWEMHYLPNKKGLPVFCEDCMPPERFSTQKPKENEFLKGLQFALKILTQYGTKAKTKLQTEIRKRRK